MDYIVYEVSFLPKEKVHIGKEGEDNVIIFLRTLFLNGLICGDYMIYNMIYKKYQSIEAVVEGIGSDIWDESQENLYIKKYRKKVEKYFEISKKEVGFSTNYDLLCTCPSSSWYLLKTVYTGVATPVVCGDCNRRVPLYKFPHILNEHEYYSVLGWMVAYESMDYLFMHGVHDRYTYRQLHKPDSQLAIEGREIAAAFEEITETPFYYFLYNYYNSPKKCPSCNRDWQTTKESIVDYKCAACRLVSDD